MSFYRGRSPTFSVFLATFMCGAVSSHGEDSFVIRSTSLQMYFTEAPAFDLVAT